MRARVFDVHPLHNGQKAAAKWRRSLPAGDDRCHLWRHLTNRVLRHSSQCQFHDPQQLTLSRSFCRRPFWARSATRAAASKNTGQIWTNRTKVGYRPLTFRGWEFQSGTHLRLKVGVLSVALALHVKKQSDRYYENKGSGRALAQRNWRLRSTRRRRHYQIPETYWPTEPRYELFPPSKSTRYRYCVFVGVLT